MPLREDAAAIAGELAELRHAIHREPEIGLDLPLTQEKVLAALDGLPLEVSTGRKLSSVTAVLRGGAGPAEGIGAGGNRDGIRPSVLLRGDMDALPVTELTGLPYASRFGGVMHACGHDLHTAMLAGAAQLLCGRRAELAGDVIFMFQPGEEGYSGADKMIGEGVLEAAGERRPVAAYALHVSSTQLPCGVFTTRPGPMLAAADIYPGDRAGPRRARVAAAPGGRPDHRGLRDGDRPADPGDAPVRRVRPGRHHGGELPRGNDRQRDPGRGAVPGDGPVIQPGGARETQGHDRPSGQRHRGRARRDRGGRIHRGVPGHRQRRDRGRVRADGRGGDVRRAALGAQAAFP